MTKDWNKIKLRIALGTGAVLAVCTGTLLQPTEFVRIYQQKLQIPFFSGFLTLAGFILALKTNLLLKLHSELFSKEKYRAKLMEMSPLGETELKVYDPLIGVGTFLIWTVLCCLVTALLQVSLGFVAWRWAAAVCIGAVGSSALLAVFAWMAIRDSLNVWFAMLKDDQNSKSGKQN